VTAGIDRLNRILVGLLGLIALAGGVIILLLSVRVFGDSRADQPILLGDTRHFTDRNAGWFWTAVGIGAGVLALLALWWLIAQARTQRLASLNLEPNRRVGHTKLSAGALTDAVADEVDRIRGVSRASARMMGSPGDPLLRVDVKLADEADLGYVRSRIEEETVPHARQAVSMNGMPVWVRLAVSGEPRRQVS
jgi:hypothetical protein